MHIQIGILSSYEYRPAPGILKWADLGETLAFGAYTVKPLARKLSRNGMPREIGSRAFDLLVVLLRGRGKLLWKEEIMRAVWPTTTVVEANLRVQIAILRKALGAEGARIKTIPGRGYIFCTDNDPLPGGMA